MSRLIQLPTGTWVAPDAIRMVEAKLLGRPYVAPDGAEWPAMVHIETRNQVVRVPCATFAEAARLRDHISGIVNAPEQMRAQPAARPVFTPRPAVEATHATADA